MGNICSSCCDPIQNWCRDSCGCCPCKCCKTTVVNSQLETIDGRFVNRKDIPFGRWRIYTGTRRSDGSYLTPVFEIHTWREERQQTNVTHVAVSQRVALGGIQTQRDNADRHIGPLARAEHRRLEFDEEIQCIPIESIISIKYSGVVKREATEHVHARIPTPPPPVQLSCCGKINRWCCTTFCCCCSDRNNQVHGDPERTINEMVDLRGERVMLIKIEYIRYSNINTPSHLGALATTDASAYYKDHLHTDTLQFYLMNNEVYDQAEYNLKRAQAASLCRLVTQLKAMNRQYPDGPALEQIINEHEVQAVGDLPSETLDRLVGPGVAAASLELRVPVAAIQN